MDPVRLSKLMSLALRHTPADFGLVLDGEGWTPLEEFVAALRARHPEIDEAAIRAVVAEVESDKQRFALAGDEIRANYGHSLAGKIRQAAAEPPALLFHGTPERAVEQILREGLRPMARQYVHLSSSTEIATRVGARRGRPVLLDVDAARAHAEGVTFYRANESFWLVDELPARYLARSSG